MTRPPAVAPERRDNGLQLALFGDPVPVPFEEPPTAPSDPAHEADVAAVLAEVSEWDRQLDLLLDSFPEEERDQAQSKVYISADGLPATRHGLLRLA